MSWGQDRAVPGMDVSRAARAIGSTEVVLGTGAAVAVGLWLARRRREAVLLGLGLVLLPLLQYGLKELVDRPRPTEELVELRAGFSSPSFPSGHVMSPTLLYGFLIALSLREKAFPALRAAVLLWSLFAVVVAGPANVYLGVHWPSDVLGGYAWGLTLLLPLVLAKGVTLSPSKGHPERAQDAP
jgi:undecaprenyl-diphosphatase